MFRLFIITMKSNFMSSVPKIFYFNTTVHTINKKYELKIIIHNLKLFNS